MCVTLCKCIYVCVYVCYTMGMYVCVYACVCVRVYVCVLHHVHACVCVSITKCMLRIHTHIHTHIHTLMSATLYICTYVYFIRNTHHIIHTHTHTHTHTNTHTHTHTYVYIYTLSRCYTKIFFVNFLLLPHHPPNPEKETIPTRFRERLSGDERERRGSGGPCCGKSHARVVAALSHSRPA